ncbi:MAG: FmdB family zinc ribbon protein [Clostridia bacterium]
MALLDFKCKDCNEKFFEIVSASNRDKVACPKCGSNNVGQIFEGSSSFGPNSGKSIPAPRRGG